MVRIHSELLLRSVNQGKRRRDETPQQYLRRVTHIYLADKGIESIENLKTCAGVKVLYLYDNSIRRIENLDFATSMTHLYLQNNEIERMENLSSLKSLTKLYLGHNRISVVENLTGLTRLQELHVEHQQLASGEQLLFEPQSLLALSRCLRVLNISGNGLPTLDSLQCLGCLEEFLAMQNRLHNLQDLLRMVSHWPDLWRLELSGNPLCEQPRYRDKVILAANNLTSLDEREITDTARSFLRKWKESRTQHREHFHSSQEALPDESSIPGMALMHRSSQAWHERPWVNSFIGSQTRAREPPSGGLPPIEARRKLPDHSRVEHHAAQVAAFHERTRLPAIYVRPSRILHTHGDGRVRRVVWQNKMTGAVPGHEQLSVTQPPTEQGHVLPVTTY